MIPCIFQAWVMFPAMGNVPLCCLPPQAEQSLLLTGPAFLCSGSMAKLQGIYSFTLTSCGFKATGQCKLCFPGPARLFLLFYFQECQQLLEASYATN